MLPVLGRCVCLSSQESKLPSTPIPSHPIPRILPCNWLMEGGTALLLWEDTGKSDLGNRPEMYLYSQLKYSKSMSTVTGSCIGNLVPEPVVSPFVGECRWLSRAFGRSLWLSVFEDGSLPSVHWQDKKVTWFRSNAEWCGLWHQPAARVTQGLVHGVTYLKLLLLLLKLLAHPDSNRCRKHRGLGPDGFRNCCWRALNCPDFCVSDKPLSCWFHPHLELPWALGDQEISWLPKPLSSPLGTRGLPGPVFHRAFSLGAPDKVSLSCPAQPWWLQWTQLVSHRSCSPL